MAVGNSEEKYSKVCEFWNALWGKAKMLPCIVDSIR
jgi:hypothetical protein